MDYTPSQLQQILLENCVLKRLLSENFIPWEEAVAAHQHRLKMADLLRDFSSCAHFTQMMTIPDLFKLVISYCGLTKPIVLSCPSIFHMDREHAPLSTRMMVLYETRTEVLNPENDVWTSYPSALGKSPVIVDYSITICKGHLYAIGAKSNVCFVRSLDLSEWGRWKFIRSPSTVRNFNEGFVLATHAGCVFLIGGEHLGQELDAVERYDPEKSLWKQCAPLKHGRSSACAVSAHGLLYILGGYCDSHSSKKSYLNTCERYDVTADHWTNTARMPTRRNECGACYWDDHIFVAGGEEYDRATRDGISSHAFERYSIMGDAWECLQPLPISCNFCFAAAIAGRIYVFGHGDDSRNKCEHYDIQDAVWRPLARSTRNVDSPMAAFVINRSWQSDVHIRSKPWEDWETDSEVSSERPSPRDID